MRRLLAWISGAAGGFALYRYATRERAAAPALPAAGPDPRAEQLRAKLEESKPLVEERAEFEAGETPVDEADPAERRRRVHEQGRSAVDEMRSSGSSSD